MWVLLCYSVQLPNERFSFLLLRHPEVLKTLRGEISLKCAGDGVLSRSDLRGMTYLQKVLKESEGFLY
jgi:Cytochrome P450